MKRFLTLSAILLAFASSGTSAAETITVSPTNPVTVTSGNANNYVFETGAVMTMTPSAGSEFTGSFSGTGGTINFSATGRAQVRFKNDLSGFGGAININGSSWFILSGANATGSANAVWTVNTTDAANDTGLLFENLSGNSATNPFKFGKVEGNGHLRTMGSGEGPYYIQVGSLLTNATDTSTFAGVIRLNGDDKTKGTFAVEKVGAGTWILTGTNSFTSGLTVSEGTLQLGNATDGGSLASTCPVTVSANGAFGYKRNASSDGDLKPQNSITVNGGTIFNAGARAVQFANVTFNEGGKIKYNQGGSIMTFQNLALTGENAGVLSIDNTNAQTRIGKLTSSGAGAKEIAASGARGNFLFLDGDVSGYTGKITANGNFWINLNAAKDCSSVCFNLNTGTDSGLLLQYTPTTETALKIGSLEGNGIVRPNSAGMFNVQVGANNQNSTFSGGFQTFNGGDFTIEKVGTGVWTITSSGETRNTGVLGDYTLNNYTGTTTITAGTLQLGDYNPTTGTGGAAGQLGISKIVLTKTGTLAFARNAYVDNYNPIQADGGTIEILSDPANSLVLRGAVSGSFVKTGQGSLGIGRDNGTNLVQITVKEGILRNWGASRLGNGSTKIVLDGGTFFEVNDKEIISNPISAASTGAIQTDSTLNYSGKLSGAGKIDVKVGTLNLSGDNSAFNGTLSLDKGETIISAQNNVGAATIELDGGRLTTPVALTNDINVTQNGGRLHITASNLYFTGKVTGSGEFKQSSNDRGQWFRIRDLDLSEFSGTITESGNNWISLQTNSSAATTWNLANTTDSGLLMDNNAANTVYKFGNLTGTGWVRTNNDGTSNTYNIEVGAKNEDGTFSGAFRRFNGAADTINVTKVGTGVWTLASENQYSSFTYNNEANINIDAGTLELARKAGQSSAINLQVEEGGTLLLSTPNQTISGSLSALANATIQVDTDAFGSPDYNPATQKELLKVSGTTTVDSNAKFAFLFDANELVSGFEQDFGLDSIVSGYTVPTEDLLASLDNYKVPGTDINLLMPLYSDGVFSGVAFNSEGVPEPASWILLILGALGIYSYRRKR